MITAIAIDDEPLALEIIKTFCEKVDYISLKLMFTSTVEAQEYLKSNPTDLLFLDINMPGISGIDFFKAYGQNSMVIFTTAYSEYAVEGFNINAIDYLLKPFKFSRFMQAVEKAKDHLSHVSNTDVSSQYLYIRADYSLQKIAFSDIFYIEGMDNYVKLHLIGKKPILVRMSMKTMVEKLPEGDFIRVHRSFIVSTKHITSVKQKSVYLEKLEIPIGLNYADNVATFFSA